MYVNLHLFQKIYIICINELVRVRTGHVPLFCSEMMIKIYPKEKKKRKKKKQCLACKA